MKTSSLIEPQVLKKINQVKLEKKSLEAWKRLEELSKKACKKWKNPKTSLQLITEGRR